MRVLRTSLTIAALLVSAQAAAPQVFAPLVGRWTGALEYRDYSSARSVRVPVVLDITASGADRARWLFTYDDFGAPVVSDETHRWMNGTYTVTTKGRAGSQTFSSRDFAALGSTGSAVLSGREQENGKPVEVRRTLTLTPRGLVTLTETRAPGGPYAVRNRSRYTRP
jgi:hypothetical protein